MLKKLSTIIFIVGIASQFMLGGTPGRIHGVIIDSSNNQPLFGAIVMLENTSMGTAADIDGKYMIQNIPSGYYTLRASYIGYRTLKIRIHLKEGESLKKDFKLEPVGVTSKTVVVTAQASGQNSAINQQLTSDKIVNVVSAARIQELPDANAAESVGRLPGVSIIRNGGEGNAVVIRGLQPKYNQIMIDGIEMAATDAGDRGSDLSMISSNMLEGIEVFKTATPDMDAAFLGGVVNFQLREAKKTATGAPRINLLAQGEYNNLQNSYNDYKFVASVEDRFLNDRFGIFAQGIVERVNLTSDQLGASYGHTNKTPIFGQFNPIQINSLNLTYKPSDRRRYDGTVVMDYQLHNGKIDFMNVFSQSFTKNSTSSQNYSIPGNTISFGEGSSPNTLNTVQNILAYQQLLFSVKVDAKLSHTYSENISPDNWSMNFNQISAGTGSISPSLSPTQMAQASNTKIDLKNLVFDGINTSNSFTRERDATGSIDLEKSFNFSDLVTTTFKMGGQYKYTYRDYKYATGSGTIFYPGNGDARAAILNAFPWMTQAPYNINPNGTQNLPITVFMDPKFSYGKFFNGDYAMGPGVNLNLIKQAVDIVRNIGIGKPGATSGDYSPDFLGSDNNNYTGQEYRSAGYFMATINVGPQITFIPGVRYQGLETSYRASRYYNAGNAPSYPNPIPHQDTTINEYNGYWLPDATLRYKPLSWFDVRLAYTNTLTYPDYSAIVPILDIYTNSITWNNFALKPAQSENYDMQFSFYDNAIGLFTAGAFLKRIDGLIFGTGTRYVTDFSKYPGIPTNLNGVYTISTSINNPYRTDVWGMEFDWQTHFWYLPDPFKGLVMNVNYTHIFSSANYPYTYTKSPPPRYIPVHIDTSYSDRLINQPNDIINFSIGYDYAGFSTRVSMQYQSNVFSGNNFYPELRSYKDRYLRWDFSAKQKLPWFGLEAYFDINNLNSENDVYIIQGSGFPTSAQDYGMTADLGLRWSLL